MANDFSTDDTCEALYNYETADFVGGKLEDQKNNNDLTEDISADEANYKQGAASGQYSDADANQTYIADADLDSGFPCKNGESNTSFSLVAWVYPSVSVNTRWILGKGNTTNNDCSFGIGMNTSDPFFIIGYNAGADAETEGADDNLLQTGRWYHYALTYDGPTKAFVFRIWDDTAGSVIYTTSGVTANAINVDSGPFWIGSAYDSTVWEWDGLVDEAVIFNRVLSASEIDQIRRGIYTGPLGESGKALLLGVNI